MGSTASMSLAIRAQLPQAVWGWLSRPVSMLTIPLDDFAPLGGLGRPCVCVIPSVYCNTYNAPHTGYYTSPPPLSTRSK
eukprot:COSAG02_NODE_4091_length_5797_cov_127.687434_9_plen_79_part_00